MDKRYCLIVFEKGNITFFGTAKNEDVAICHCFQLLFCDFYRILVGEAECYVSYRGGAENAPAFASDGFEMFHQLDELAVLIFTEKDAVEGNVGKFSKVDFCMPAVDFHMYHVVSFPFYQLLSVGEPAHRIFVNVQGGNSADDDSRLFVVDV